MIATEKESKTISLPEKNGIDQLQERTASGPDFDEIDIFTVLHFFWKRKWLIIGGTIFFGLLGGALSKLVPPTYQATGVLHIGRTFLEGGKKLELIDSLDRAKEFLLSERNLMGLAKELGIEYDYKSLNSAFVITGDERDVTPVPERFVNVTFSNREPSVASKAIDFVANQLIAFHETYYLAAFNNLNRTIKRTQLGLKNRTVVIAGLQAQIAVMKAQSQSDKKYEAYLDRQATASSLSQHMHIQNEINGLGFRLQDREVRILELFNQVSQLQDEVESSSQDIEKLESYKQYFKNTELLSAPVVSKKQQTGLLRILMLSGFVGFIVTFGFAVFWENRKNIIYGDRRNDI